MAAVHGSCRRRVWVPRRWHQQATGLGCHRAREIHKPRGAVQVYVELRSIHVGSTFQPGADCRLAHSMLARSGTCRGCPGEIFSLSVGLQPFLCCCRKGHVALAWPKCQCNYTYYSCGCRRRCNSGWHGSLGWLSCVGLVLRSVRRGSHSSKCDSFRNIHIHAGHRDGRDTERGVAKV